MSERYYIEIDRWPKGPNPECRAYGILPGVVSGARHAAVVALRMQQGAVPAGDGDEFKVTVTDRKTGTIARYHATADISVTFDLADDEKVLTNEDGEEDRPTPRNHQPRARGYHDHQRGARP
jgi:hypothetical protein